LQDLQLEIIEIVEAVRSPFDDGDLGIEGFACRIGDSISEVIQDAIEIGREGLDHRIEWRKERFAALTFSNHPPFHSLQRSCFVSFLEVEDVQSLLFQQIRRV
jgi:hypothetical protein